MSRNTVENLRDEIVAAVQNRTISPIVARAATEPGALDGFEARCDCGLVLRSSLRSSLERDVIAHARFHERSRA